MGFLPTQHGLPTQAPEHIDDRLQPVFASIASHCCGESPLVVGETIRREVGGQVYMFTPGPDGSGHLEVSDDRYRQFVTADLSKDKGWTVNCGSLSVLGAKYDRDPAPE